MTAWAPGLPPAAGKRRWSASEGRNAANFAELAAEVGAKERTAWYRLELERKLAEERGVRLGSGKGDPTGKAANFAALAAEVGVKERTARYKLELERKLAEERGVRLGQGARNDLATSAKFAEVAGEVGVKVRTAQYRLELERKLADHPDLAEAVDADL